MSAGEVAIRELDWYLRDHLFRRSNAGTNTFSRGSLPSDMVAIYLRYRNEDPRQLSETMIAVIHNLVARKVLIQNGDELKLGGILSRLQCTKCFYINYLTDIEPRACIRCQQGELQDFPKRKPKAA